MKQSNKSSLLTGIILLTISALFTISLILQPLDFGPGSSGHNNVFYLLGNMIFTVYGFSSILIPVFIFIAGLSCFASKWNARKSMRLLTALVPFFTSVITENIIRSVLDLGKSNFVGLKITVAVIIGLMLIIIEYLGIGILADKVNAKIYEKTGLKKPEVQEEENSEDLEELEISQETPEETISDEDYKKIKKSTIFDEVLSKVHPKIEEKSEEIIENVETPAEENKNLIEEKIQEEKVDTDEEMDKNPASIITMDEYAALTAQPEENEENPVEELEWNNVPPAPEKLPDDYKDDSFDEEDPALEFPPKEEDLNQKSESSENQDDEEIAEDDIIEEETPDFTVDTDFTVDADLTEDTEFTDEDENFEEENPYAAARFIDTAVEHPKYPSSIVIADDEDEENVEENEETFEKAETPKFPSKITLNDNSQEIQEDDLDTEISDFEESLNETSFDEIEEPAINQNNNEEKDPFEGISNLEFSDFEDEKDNNSEEIQFDEEIVEENPLEEEIPEEKPESVEKKSFFEKINEPEKTTFSSSISSVFSDMEADIRKHHPIPEVVEDDDEEIADTSVNVNFNGEIEEDSDEYQNVNPVEETATVLTKDDLTDFFNAQQEENTPKTKEILPNPPRNGNMAMKKGPYLIPSDLLIAYKDDKYWIIDDTTKQAALNLKQTLSEFNIEATIIEIKKGPVVTMFEILPAPGVKLSKIVSLQDNIALALAAQSVRIVAPIPGKQAVGIEVPNKHRSIVGFREIIEMELPEWQKMAVPVILGKDILGKAQLIDLVKTPHMLIAGATGSGKSVCVNSLILSILYKRSPRDVKMILVDPKVVELKLYNDIPHLLTPVITEPKKALQSLQWCLCEMERRYALLDGMGVRDISNYNIKIKEQNIATEKLPYIVVIIDEFADLMATSGKEMESVVARLTAMSRAVGIHLVLATQRPSVNVITGLIKANIPTRIAFMVASRTDSNIIIDSVGAEKLLGRGDMLYASAVDPAPIRIQGTFVSDQEVEDVVNAVKEYGEPDYLDDEIFTDDDDEEGARDLFGDPMDDEDPLYDQALEIVVQAGKASASYLQRRLKIGYNRAARLVEEMEERGIVGAANGSKPREVIHIP